jgi:hypothetical protein
MKRQEIIIKDAGQKSYLKEQLNAIPEDGSVTVIIKKTDHSSTAKQRRLTWLWNTEVANSGIGQDDSALEVHTRAKYKFGLPILLRDNEMFAVLWEAFQKTVSQSSIYAIYVKDFTIQYISTERMTRAQRAEYLTAFQRYWIMNGVELTDPSTQGLDRFLGYKPKGEQNVRKSIY